MKKISILLFLFAFSKSFSQIIIKGKITDEVENVVENASIIIEEINDDDSIIAFSLSDSNGNYYIKFKNLNQKYRVTVTSINHRKITQEITAISQTLNFTLSEVIREIQEVNIQSKIIQQKNDTLSYNLKSFEGKEDRTLSDVLKKIPGIEVDINGLIKYQGNPINKFYVEGKDLMAGGYGTLTNSLPKDAISKLQVLENHQPIKTLKNKVPSYRAAINIKLKKNITLTGRADIGVGFSPFLWSTKITPMLFTKKYQYLLNYKSNNNGEDVISEIQTFSFDEGFEGLTIDNQTGTWLNVYQTSLPKINEKRYLFNKTQLFSANLLTNLSKDWEFKTNISFFNNSIERNGNEFTKINFFDSNGDIQNSIEYNRESRTGLDNNQLRSQLIFTKNTEKSFFKNTVTYKGNWDKIIGNSVLNSAAINQYLVSPGFSFQNSLSSIVTIGKKIVNLKSIVNYIEDEQTYSVSPYSSLQISEFPSNDSERINQNIYNSTFDLHNEMSLIILIKKFSIIPTFSFQVENKNLNTELFGKKNTTNYVEFGNDFRNNLNWKKFIPISNFSINYIGESFSLNLNLPSKYNYIKVDDRKNDFSKKLNKFTFEPNLSLKYKLSTELSKTLYASISNDFGTLNSIYPSNIFSTLNLTNQKLDIREDKTNKIGGNLEYKFIIENLFLNLNYELSKKISNNSISENISENGQTIFEQISTKNKTIHKRINFEISKYIPIAKSKLSFKYGFSNNKNNIFLNNIESNIISNSNIFNYKMNINYFSWVTIDYNINYSINKIANLKKSNNVNSILKCYFYPFKNHSIGLYFENYKYNFDTQKLKNKFCDISYMYTLEKRKIDLEVRYTNVFNINNYNEIIINNFGYTSNSFEIRPSQIIATVKFNFN